MKKLVGRCDCDDAKGAVPHMKQSAGTLFHIHATEGHPPDNGGSPDDAKC